MQNWSAADKLKFSQRVDETNKIWGASQEQERKVRVANELEKNKSKINSADLTSKNQSSSSKSQKM